MRHLIFLPIFGSFDKNSELVIGDFIHLIQEENEDYYVTMKIARDTDITQTISGSTCCLRASTMENICLLNRAMGYQYCRHHDSSLFILFEFDKLEKLEKVLEFCDSTTYLFYFHQVLGVISRFLEEKILLKKLDFFVDLKFNVGLFDFNMEALGEGNKSVIVENLIQMFGKFLKDDAINIANDNIMCSINNLIAKISEKINTLPFNRAFLKHKTLLLNSL